MIIPIASLFLETWTIKGDALHISTLAKKKPNIIPLEEIQSYVELPDEKSSRKDLLIFTTNKKYHLHSSLINFSVQFQKELIRGKPQNEAYIRAKENQLMNILRWLSLVAGLGFLLLFTYNLVESKQEFNQERYVEVSGTLANRLNVERYRSGKSGYKKRIQFTMPEHDSILFEIEDRLIPFVQTKRLTETVLPGDSIVLFVEESPDSILSKSQSGTILEWLTTSRLVEVHGFRSKGYDYLFAYDSYVQKKSRSSGGIPFPLIIGIILTALGIIWFIRPNIFSTTKSAISNRK